MNKLLILLFSLSIPLLSYGQYQRAEITIKEVALSQHSNRVFIVASPSATDTTCTSKDHYSMSIDKPEAFLFYSAALTAMNEGKKMRVQYSETECIGNGPVVNVFWNLAQ